MPKAYAELVVTMFFQALCVPVSLNKKLLMGFIKSYTFLKKSLLFVLLVFLLPLSAQAQKAANTFIENHQDVARDLMMENGIPASLILGISMIESAMGTSKNCKVLKNYFGIKGKNSLSKKGKHRSAYKEYHSPRKSFEDFIRIVKKKKWYNDLKGNMDYNTWLLALRRTGYAEAGKKWIADIKKVIEDYNLTQFDSTSVAVYGL